MEDQLLMTVPSVGFTDERLPNGLRLIVSQDGLAPVVAVNVWYHVGSANEVQGKTGFAHLFEHLMFQGSGHVGKSEHMALVQAAGGTMNGTTFLDRTNYFETVPSHQLELALWLEADRMATLLDALNQDNLDNQRDVVKNEKRSSYDNRPYGDWFHRMQAAVYPEGHPYAHPTIGSMADLDAASLDDVTRFFQTYYAPNNAVVAIVGDVDPAQARAWVDRYFGPIPANPGIPTQVDAGTVGPLEGERREVLHERVPLPRIFFGFRGPVLGDPRLDAVEVGAQILAGGKGSRLHRRLVRDQKIAQDVWLSAVGPIRGSAIIIGSATVRPEVDPAVVERAFTDELEKLGHEPVTDDELARARALIETYELEALQHVEERADRLAQWATLLDDPDMINRQLARYLAVTKDEILSVAAELYGADKRVMLTYLPGEPGAEPANGEETVA
jgi:zinc protease